MLYVRHTRLHVCMSTARAPTYVIESYILNIKRIIYALYVRRVRIYFDIRI